MYLKCIPLIDQVLLPFGGEIHLSGVCAHKGVEEGVESACGVWLRSQDTTQSLSFLPSSTKVTTDLCGSQNNSKIETRLIYNCVDLSGT